MPATGFVGDQLCLLCLRFAWLCCFQMFLTAFLVGQGYELYSILSIHLQKPCRNLGYFPNFLFIQENISKDYFNYEMGYLWLLCFFLIL